MECRGRGELTALTINSYQMRFMDRASKHCMHLTLWGNAITVRSCLNSRRISWSFTSLSQAIEIPIGLKVRRPELAGHGPDLALEGW